MAHLSFLKLPAAAEALPGILDAARGEGLSTVAVLEALLAVEVETTQARRLAARLRFACLPTDSSLDAFDFTAQPGVSHTGITEWGERLGDPMLAATVLDRLLHTGIVGLHRRAVVSDARLSATQRHAAPRPAPGEPAMTVRDCVTCGTPITVTTRNQPPLLLAALPRRRPARPPPAPATALLTTS